MTVLQSTGAGEANVNPPSSLRRSGGTHRSAVVGVPRSARILIVGDTRLHREGLARLLRSRQVGVVGTASPNEALSRFRKDQPNIVLLDAPLEEVLSVVSKLRNVSSDVKSVVIGISEESADVIAWAEAGVAGYTTTDDSLDGLIAAIAGVIAGETLCSPRVAAILGRRVETLASAGATVALGSLTQREIQVADLLAAGLSNKEIAVCLSVALPTVKTHVHSILGKLNVRRRGEAAARLHLAGPRP
jgi:two-component system, NarL family, nitrate/nitrite response regulator NarL